MVKQPLTEQGVMDKQDELFSLSDSDLDGQSMALASDFKSWVEDNFTLTTAEQGFLASADENFIRLLSSLVFMTVRNRLPVNFSTSPIVTAVKRFETTAAIDFQYQWDGALTQHADVSLEIIYD